jgi:hypothetical protein
MMQPLPLKRERCDVALVRSGSGAMMHSFADLEFARLRSRIQDLKRELDTASSIRTPGALAPEASKEHNRALDAPSHGPPGYTPP